MDAASNNGVEDIREIREKVNFLPTFAKYRVYIIDEVHMLSTGAFNALLKTLEEPPEHVKFILATTEPQKLPATILSRCQRFDFKKISNEDIIKRLKIVCEESGIQITEGALNLIAVLSEGAARDALSILERCLQDGNTSIDEDRIKELVGIPKFVYVYNVLKGIIEKDVEEALKAIDNVLEEGKDLENFALEMIKQTKDILMYKVSKKADIYNDEEVKQIADVADKASKDELINIIYKLSELESKMKISSQKTIIFEAEIIKLCIKTDTKSLEDRITALEEALKSGKEISPKNKIVASAAPVKQTMTELPKIEENKAKSEVKEVNLKENESNSQKETGGNEVNGWQDVLERIKAQGKVILYANLINTSLNEINDMTVEIVFHNGLNDFRKALLEKSENMNLLSKEIAMLCKKPMQIKFVEGSSNIKNADKKTSIKKEVPKAKEETEDDVLSNLDIPINIIEEEE